MVLIFNQYKNFIFNRTVFAPKTWVVTQTVQDQREKDSTSQRECEQEDTLSSSWARRLFNGDPQMVENGRRPHCEGNRTDDF